MARPKRFELLAYRFVACCSIQLSYERVNVFLEDTTSSVKKLFAVLGFDGVDGAGQAGHLAGGLLPVDGAFAGGLGQHGGGGAQGGGGLRLVAGGNGGANGLDGVFHTGTGGAVDGGALQALLVTFDGGLMVSHDLPP